MRASPGTPRAAVQIDPAELEDFQRAARILLAHPLVTARWPTPGALALVRRWEVALSNEMNRVLGFRLDVGRTAARLYRRSARLSTHRGATLATGRTLGRTACSLLCLVLAAVESLGEQATLSGLAEEVLRLRAGDDDLPLDLTQYDQRRALVDAVKWLEERGVLTLRDGASDRWLSDAEDGDALYDLDRDAASRLLVAAPSVLRDVTEAADFLVEPRRPTSPDGDSSHLRHRISRRLIEDPVVLYAELSPDELAHVRLRRNRITEQLERLTGCPIEARAEGLVLVDASVSPISAHSFPSNGTVAHAALLWGAALVELASSAGSEADLIGTPTSDERAARPQEDVPAEPAGITAAPTRTPLPAPSPGRKVRRLDADETWAEVVAQYGSRFSNEYRNEPERLQRRVLDLLESFGLVSVTADDDGGRVSEGEGDEPGSLDQPDIIVLAALARYRAEVRMAPSPQLSLLDGGSP